MIESDKQEFKRMLNAVMVIYYKPMLTNDALRIWWFKLDGYEFDVVTKAFDTFTNNVQNIPTPPTPADIKNLCQHKVTIHARLPSPLAIAENKVHVEKLNNYITENLQKKNNKRDWARKIIANAKNYPDISFRLATEALSAKAE